MFVSEKNSTENIYSESDKPKKVKDNNLLQKPLDFEGFFLNRNAKQILEEINKKSKYQKRRSEIESTIVSNTEYSETDNLSQQYNFINHNRNKFINENIYEIKKNEPQTDFESDTLSNVFHNSIPSNEVNEHNVEVTRDYKLNNQEEIRHEDINYNNIYSNIEKVENTLEINEDDQGYYVDNLVKNEDEILPKKVNIFKKVDVKMCVWIFLSYAFLDTFIAVYNACTPLQMAFIVMLMGSLLFFKYT
ncbi:Hypothetical protein SRAE_1000134500 [Strongyloides ratti]|uniref:Uncharacterized protein n=1 Tax=Strongyloides ratti TaxID=34506 RepID=A0A090KZX4_STRRB|nr:Hypothetical protein SRAE_1000134500 [Strongyloides ratti]CEF63080.1 Hypothetical protein SRAE_1000134500 [Strongyloides ratti]